MKTINLPKILASLTVAFLALAGSASQAQQSAATNAQPPLMVYAQVPRLSPSTRQILQLSKAKVSDGTIVAFIKSTHVHFGLDANAIIYLQQQGISEAIINAMLTQSALVLATTPLPPPPPAPLTDPQPVFDPASTVPTTTVIDASSTTYVEVPSPITTYYFQPAYGIYANPNFGCNPNILPKYSWNGGNGNQNGSASGTWKNDVHWGTAGGGSSGTRPSGYLGGAPGVHH